MENEEIMLAEKEAQNDQVLKELIGKTVPMAYHETCISRKERLVHKLILGWAISIVCVVAVMLFTFAYMWLQYDYSGSTENTGMYVVSDGNGNVLASDLEPEDVIHIMQEIMNGKN